MLAPRSSDRILEIGCGTGVAAELICRRLGKGTLTAIDRSAAAIARARVRLASCIAAGTVRLHGIPLHEAAFGGERFDRVFAVNVNLFWTHDPAELDVVAGLMAPRGRLFLFYQPPSAARIEPLVEKLTRHLIARRFRPAGVRIEELSGGPGVCVTATRPAR